MGIQLLIVEDSEHIRTSLIGLMECIPGISGIYTASCLQDAKQCMREFAPSLVVLDLQLPDGFGVELIEPIKALIPDVRIAVLTNHASEFNKRHCMDCGADWFFDKSIEIDGLLEVVRSQAAPW